MVSVYSSGIMASAAELLRSVAAVLWPLIVLFAVCAFKPEISSVFKRLRELNVFGQQLRLDESLDTLQKDAQTLERSGTRDERVDPSKALSLEGSSTISIASEGWLTLQSEPDGADESKGKSITPRGDEKGPNATSAWLDLAVVEREILEESVRSPKVGLMLLSVELERAMRQALAVSGWLVAYRWTSYLPRAGRSCRGAGRGQGRFPGIPFDSPEFCEHSEPHCSWCFPGYG